MTIKQRNVSSIDNLATFSSKASSSVWKTIVRTTILIMAFASMGMEFINLVMMIVIAIIFVELRHSYLYCTNFSRHQRRRRQWWFYNFYNFYITKNRIENFSVEWMNNVKETAVLDKRKKEKKTDSPVVLSILIMISIILSMMMSSLIWSWAANWHATYTKALGVVADPLPLLL